MAGWGVYQYICAEQLLLPTQFGSITTTGAIVDHISSLGCAEGRAGGAARNRRAIRGVSRALLDARRVFRA
eukprot:6522727-Pyramimonas_sp.AAC.1